MPIKKEAPTKEASSTSIAKIVEEVKPQALKGMDFANKIAIRTQKDLETAKEFLTRIMKFKKEVKEKKDGIVSPLNIALKNAKELFAPIEASIANAEDVVKSKMLGYNSKVQAEAAKKEAEVMQKIESGELDMTKAGEKLEKVQDKVDSIPTRKVAKMNVIDENLVPDEYWMIDLVKLRRAALAAHDIGKSIPGTEVVMEETIVGRSF